MANITAAMVKDLRERTGLGMMDCKKALAEADGDIEKAIDDLRKASGMKAAKKRAEWRQTVLWPLRLPQTATTALSLK